MRTKFGLFISLLLVAGCNRPDAHAPQSPAHQSEAQTEDGTNVVLVYTPSDDKTYYKFEVPRATIEGLPDWGPASNSIPLQPQRAAQLALERYKSIYPTASSFTPSEIELRPIDGTHPSKWLYYVRFDSSEYPGGPTKKAVRFLIMLLDGTVVDPSKDPHPERRIPFSL